MPSWAEIGDLIEKVGLLRAVFTIFFFVMHVWLYRMYLGRLADRQEEVKRLAADNHEYRERFLAILDKHQGYTPPPPPRQIPGPNGTEKKKKKKED